MPSLFIGLFFFMTVIAPVWSDAVPMPQPAKIINSYSGGFKDEYPQELVRVQSYVLSVQSEIATQLGLQVGQGFVHPVTIHFDDGAPAVNENPFFYVQAKGSGPEFRQELIANVEAFAKRRSDSGRKEGDLRNGFRYALTQTMLNDLSAGDSDRALPLWAQEGLSVFVSGDGEDFVRKAAERTVRSKARDLTQDLNSPGPYLTKRDWASYYLAVKYISEQGGLQAFVRAITSGKSSSDSVRDALSQEWPAFEANVRAYSVKNFEAFTLEDDDTGSQSKNQSRR
jgi:hypothetical protein